jgi:hypothetical protein
VRRDLDHFVVVFHAFDSGEDIQLETATRRKKARSLPKPQLWPHATMEGDHHNYLK